jgi:hypothetical protein
MSTARSEITISRELAEQIDRALTATITNAIAHYSNEPYLDDPRWTPWTRFGRRVAARADEARKEIRKVLGS